MSHGLRRIQGYSVIEVLVVVGIGVAVYLIYSAVSYFFQSPDTLELNTIPPSTRRPVVIPIGSSRPFSVKATYDSSASAAGSQEVYIREDDIFDEIIDKSVLVNYAAGATTGTGRFDLHCVSQAGILVGDDNRSGAEERYHVYAEYGNGLLLPDIQSANLEIICE